MSDEHRRSLPPIFRVRTIALLLLVVLLGIWGIHRWRVDSRLKAGKEALRAAGAPVTLKELDDFYAPPPLEEDATGTLLMAFDSLRHLDAAQEEKIPITGRVDLPEAGTPLPAEQLAIIDRLLSQNAQALDLIHEGAAVGRARWPVNLAAGPAMVLPHNDRIREAARLVSLEAIAKSEHGNAAGAIDAVRTSVGLSRCLADEPLLISQYVRLACLGLTSETAAYVVGHATLTEAQLAELEEILEDAEPNGSTATGMIGERCLSLNSAAFRAAGPGATKNIGGLVVGTIYRGLGIAAMDQSFMVSQYNDLIATAKLPSDEQWAAQQRYLAERDEPGRLMLMSQILIPAVGKSLNSELRATAELRALQAAAIVERYKLRHGTYPETADAISAELPRDPFSEGPIIYQRTETGYVVYSIGDNGKDDGGPRPPGEDTGRRGRWKKDIGIRGGR